MMVLNSDSKTLYKPSEINPQVRAVLVQARGYDLCRSQ